PGGQEDRVDEGSQGQGAKPARRLAQERAPLQQKELLAKIHGIHGYVMSRTGPVSSSLWFHADSRSPGRPTSTLLIPPGSGPALRRLLRCARALARRPGPSCILGNVWRR